MIIKCFQNTVPKSFNPYLTILTLRATRSGSTEVVVVVGVVVVVHVVVVSVVVIEDLFYDDNDNDDDDDDDDAFFKVEIIMDMTAHDCVDNMNALCFAF